jgi:hypothetical protein
MEQGASQMADTLIDMAAIHLMPNRIAPSRSFDIAPQSSGGA